MFNTLYSKLVATLVVLFVLVTVMFYLLLRAAFMMQEERVTQMLHAELADRLVRGYALGEGGTIDGSRLDERLFAAVMAHNPTVEAYRLDAQGRILAHAAPADRVRLDAVSLAPITEFLKGNARYPVRGDDPRYPGRRSVFSAARIGTDAAMGGYLYLVLASEEREQAMRASADGLMLRQTGGVMAGGLIAALLAGFVAFNVHTQRLERLVQAMAALRGSDFSTPAQYVHGTHRGAGDEIDQLGTEFNAMAQRISAQVSELKAVDATRRELIANVSHDLRTPLASLRGYLDTLLLKYNSLSESERRYYLETAARQSERLGKLVGDLFDLAKLDARDVKPQLEAFSLAELVHDVVQGLSLGASEQGVTLSATVPPGLPFAYGDIGLLERVLQNLIGNALRHTPRGGRVQVVLVAQESRVRVEVSDTGEGIPPEAIERIFERFFTLDRSSASSGGAGLGLAIAKRIVELHGSALTVSSELGVGTRLAFSVATQARA